MKINLNDSCTVVLSQEGASYLNNINKEANKQFRVGFKTNWKEHDKYTSQLWSLMEIFGSSLGLGTAAPFYKCEVEINK